MLGCPRRGGKPQPRKGSWIIREQSEGRTRKSGSCLFIALSPGATAGGKAWPGASGLSEETISHIYVPCGNPPPPSPTTGEWIKKLRCHPRGKGDSCQHGTGGALCREAPQWQHEPHLGKELRTGACAGPPPGPWRGGGRGRAGLFSGRNPEV